MPNQQKRLPKEHPWQSLLIKDEDLVCRLGDHLKLIADFEGRQHEIDETPGPMTYTKAAGQLYRVDDRKGAGWDLVRISGDGPDEVRVLNGDVFDYFEIVT